MRFTLKVILAAVVLCAAGTGAWADDLRPPLMPDAGFDRGMPGTTVQEWSFSVESTVDEGDWHVYEPDLTNNPGARVLHKEGIMQPKWVDTDPDEFGTAQGILPLNGTIIIELPNFPPSPSKEIWLQLTWFDNGANDGPGVAITGAEGPAQDYTWSVLEDIGTIDLQQTPAGMWKHTTYQGFIFPNPIWESIQITGAICVDQVVVDTYCPEPASMSVLVLGALGALVRKRH
ncbi:MAG: hypothetical protein ACLFV7_08530 [Phycisphaerae bacterium]